MMVSNRNLLCQGAPIFRCELLVSGRVKPSRGPPYIVFPSARLGLIRFMAVVVSRNILKRRCSRMKFLLDIYYVYTAHVSSRLRQLLHRIWVFHVTVVASGHLKFVDSFFRLKSDIYIYICLFGKHSAELIAYSRVDRENLDILRGTQIDSAWFSSVP